MAISRPLFIQHLVQPLIGLTRLPVFHAHMHLSLEIKANMVSFFLKIKLYQLPKKCMLGLLLWLIKFLLVDVIINKLYLI